MDQSKTFRQSKAQDRARGAIQSEMVAKIRDLDLLLL